MHVCPHYLSFRFDSFLIHKLFFVAASLKDDLFHSFQFMANFDTCRTIKVDAPIIVGSIPLKSKVAMCHLIISIIRKAKFQINELVSFSTVLGELLNFYATLS